QAQAAVCVSIWHFSESSGGATCSCASSAGASSRRRRWRQSAKWLQRLHIAFAIRWHRFGLLPNWRGKKIAAGSTNAFGELLIRTNGPAIGVESFLLLLP